MNFKNWVTGALICTLVHALGVMPAAVQGQDQIPTKEGVNGLLELKTLHDGENEV